MECLVNSCVVALVTGASSGIGYEYARQLAARGFDLLIVSNEKEKIEDAAQMFISESGVKVQPLFRDLSAPNAAIELFGYCKENDITVEILVNNAGIFFFRDITDVDEDRLSILLHLHILTATMLCRFFGREMASRGKGYILNMASMAGWLPYPGISVYAATKSYLITLSKAVYNELYDKGVGVTVVCPGGVATNLYHLSRKLMRLGVRLGVLMPSDRLARKGLKAMFSKKRCVIPGVINYLFLPLAKAIPSFMIRYVKRHSKLYRYGL